MSVAKKILTGVFAVGLAALFVASITIWAPQPKPGQWQDSSAKTSPVPVGGNASVNRQLAEVRAADQAVTLDQEPTESQLTATSQPSETGTSGTASQAGKDYVTQAERDAAADRLGKQRAAAESLGLATFKAAQVMDPNATPDYFGVANWANSPLPTLATSSTRPNGSLVKTASAPQVYLLEAGQKRWATSLATFASYGFRWDRVETISQPEMDSFPAGADLRSRPGTLLKGSAPNVYVTDFDGLNYIKRWVSSLEAFASMGYYWEDVYGVSDTELNQYGPGTNVSATDTVHPNGSLVKTATSLQVYLLEAGQRRWVTSLATFSSHVFRWDRLQIISQTEMDSFPAGADLRSRPGALLKGSAPNVYVTDLLSGNYSKRWITMPAVFTGFNYRWEDIMAVSDAELANYADGIQVAQSPSVVSGTGVRKFADTLPGLGAAKANNLGQYIPVATANTTTFPGSDYYEIELVQYTEQMHSDLPATKLRGYRQTNMGGTPAHYLGPTIVARRGTPVRIKFTNSLPTGAGGDLFIPVDTTVMGSGMAPNGTEMYTQNRATLHLHGGFVPWISDGTPHQWTTPALEPTSYPKGVSVQNVPDMAAPGDGSLTFYYNNQQSARLQFYHDHSYGITRLNVYAGEAAPYIVQDTVEDNLITSGVIPGHADEIPLVIQDRTFVPDNGQADGQLARTDPTWDIGKWGGKGSFWYPHVYMPNQNPADPGGMNAFGRWHYGPWFFPPTTDITHPPVANPYAGPGAPWENLLMPGTPTPSMAMEAFMDTPVVNGTAYPTLTVDPKAYRFRILNAADDRFFNLQLYKADPAVATLDGRTLTEVKMVPALATAGFPNTWPVDGREGGVPDYATRGPDFIQIGNEGGFLPAPAVIANQPIDWNLDPTTFNFGNVSSHALLLGTAERADVIVDFSQYAGQTLILYNDSPAPFPALDKRYDYFTDDADHTATGGAPTTLAGFGPNTRTIMQIKVNAGTPAPFNLAGLQNAWAATGQGVFAASQDKVLIPSADYNSAYTGGNFAVDPYARIFESSKTFTTVDGTSATVPFQPKAVHDEMGAAYDEYGRQSGFLGLELPATVAPGAQSFILYPYATPPVDVVADNVTPAVPATGDGTQIWKITHNGVDTHTIHFHLFNVQLLNRVAWDNIVIPPDANELGWKETVRVNPLEDTIVALRPFAPTQPFAVPNSVRRIDPTMPADAPLMAGPVGFFDPSGQPITVTNQLVNFGWEYVWHCHILAHEEMDMMHPLVFAVGAQTAAPSNLTTAAGVNLTWTDNSASEIGFTVQWATSAAGRWTNLTTTVPAHAGPGTVTYTDTSVFTGTRYYRVAANGVDTVAGVPGFNYAWSNVASYTVP